MGHLGVVVKYMCVCVCVCVYICISMFTRFYRLNVTASTSLV